MVESQQASSQGIKAGISTTSFGHLRGFTLTVLELLESGGLTTHQVAEITQKTTLYVNVYLFRLQKYGLALKNEGFWFLTEKGAQISKMLMMFNNNNNNNNRSITQQQHNNNRSITLDSQKCPVQLSLANWSRRDSLSDCEKTVVEALLDHYNETGSKFLFFENQYTLSERLGFNVDVLDQAIQHLREDQLVYLVPDKTQGCWKLGLKIAFVELLKKNRGESSR